MMRSFARCTQALAFVATLPYVFADFTQASYGIQSNGYGYAFMSPDGKFAVASFYAQANFSVLPISLTNTVYSASASGLAAVASISSVVNPLSEIVTSVSNSAAVVVTIITDASTVNVRNAPGYNVDNQVNPGDTPQMAKISGDALTLAIQCDACGPVSTPGIAVYRRADAASTTKFPANPTTTVTSVGWGRPYGSGQVLTNQGGFVHMINRTQIEVQSLQGGSYASTAVLNMTGCPASAGGSCDCGFLDVGISSDGTTLLATVSVSSCPPPSPETATTYVVLWQQLDENSDAYSLITIIPAPATHPDVAPPSFVQSNRVVLTWIQPGTQSTAIGIYGVSDQNIGLVLQQSMPGAPCAPGDSDTQTFVVSGQDGNQIATSSVCQAGSVQEGNQTLYLATLLYTATPMGTSPGGLLPPLLLGIVIGCSVGGAALLCSIFIACGCCARICARTGKPRTVGEVVLPKHAAGSSPSKSQATAAAGRTDDIGARNTTPMLAEA